MLATATGGGTTGYRDPGLRGDHLAWRGGAIIASVESAKDMWMKQEEWAHYGVALLRERLSFGPIQLDLHLNSKGVGRENEEGKTLFAKFDSFLSPPSFSKRFLWIAGIFDNLILKRGQFRTELYLVVGDQLGNDR